MESEERVIESPVRLPGLILVPIASVSHQHGRNWFFGVKQASGIVVISRQGNKAFRISGEEVSLETILQEVPALNDILARFE